jgi:hypothetical protein
MITFRSVILRLRNVSDRSCIENQNTHFIFSGFLTKTVRFCLGNVEKFCRTGEDTDDSITRRLCFACWITKPTSTHSEHVVFIAFFTLTMVAWTLLNVTLFCFSPNCLICFSPNCLLCFSPNCLFCFSPNYLFFHHPFQGDYGSHKTFYTRNTRGLTLGNKTDWAWC